MVTRSSLLQPLAPGGPAASSYAPPPSSSAPASSSGSSSGVESVVAGLVAGCVTRSCTSPLDVLKILIQVSPSSSATTVLKPSSPSFAAAAATVSVPAASSSAAARASSSTLARTVRDLYKLDGVRAFWRGNTAGCCRLGPYAGAKFYLFDSLQAKLLANNELDKAPSHVQRAMCGALAGLMATMITYPLEVVRTRMISQALTPQAAHQQIRGVVQGVRLILYHEGLRGLYKGGCSAIVGAIPFEGVQFGCYEYLKSVSQRHQWPAYRWPEGKTELDGVDYFVCGSIAGAIAQTVAYPFDTVKKRLQNQSAAPRVRARGYATKAVAPNATYYRGMVDCFQKVIRDEGFVALYRGTVPNLARIVPYAAVMFSTYEMTKKSLRLLSQSTSVE